MNRLLILSKNAKALNAQIEAAKLDGLDIRATNHPEEAVGFAGDSNIILGDPPLLGDVIPHAQRLRWLQSAWAGIDCLVRPGMRRDYVLTGVKDVFGPLISEYVMGYLLAIERGMFTMRDNQQNRHWQPLAYRPLKEVTMGIAGLGSIGQHLARTAQGFGLQVTGLSRTGRPCEGVGRVYTVDERMEFFEQADYVVLTLPETPQTRHLVNARMLEVMKPTSVLINVGRGSVVCEPELVAALERGKIAGAVLDVFEQEPLATGSPLWTMPGVFVTPHNAATSFVRDIAGIFVDNYQRFVSNRPLNYVVNFELGY